MTKNFTHLHVHTSYSILDGISKREELIKIAKERNMPGMAITEHGNVYNYVSFYKECTEAGIVPIIGYEAYVSPGSRFDRVYSKKGEAEEDAKNGDLTLYAYHLTVLAKNRQGYENLKQLATLAFREGFYRKPRIDDELLTKYKDGLIILSGCLASRISRLVVAGNKQMAVQEIDKMRSIFGEDFYLEVMAHNIPEEKVVREALIDIGRTHGVPLVMTGDSHFTNHGDEQAHEVALAIGTKKLLRDENRFKFNGNGYWFKTADEMWNIAKEAGIPDEALDNTNTICRSVQDYDIKLISKTKSFQVPLFRDQDGSPYTDEQCHEILDMRAWQGLAERGLIDSQQHRDRLSSELAMIKKKNFSSYFLILADIVDFMRREGIIVPIGRGSSCGSLVCYSLFIIGLDPIEMNIPFSRFINEGRKDLPDVDTDISKVNRGRVLNYIATKYGHDRVAHIVTYSTMRPKAALDNVGRVLDVPNQVRKQVTKDIYDDPTSEDTLIDIIGTSSIAKMMVDQVPSWLDISCRLEGNNTTVSSHAAGIVISNEPLIEYTPLMRDGDDGIAITQLDMIDLAELGLLKLDMLGLKTLDVIADTIDLAKTLYGDNIDFHHVKRNDKATYDTIASGKFVSVFQYDSSGMRALAKQLNPTDFEHLIAMNALYRPGPMLKEKGGKSILEQYVDRRHGREEIETWHPELDKTFSPTLGLCLFQEQVMELAQIMAGFNEVEADEYRSAIGKKNRVKFLAAQDKFIKHGVENGRDFKLMQDLANKLAGFARYGWNRGHSVAYSYISYVTAWLETHYPHAYYTSLLNTFTDDSDKMKVLIASILQKGTNLLPPDVNSSSDRFTTDGKSIFMGLHSVKQVASHATNAIVDERKNGPYTSYIDFCIRLSKQAKYINKTVKDNLIKAGAFSWDKTLTNKDKLASTELIKKIIDKFTDRLDPKRLEQEILNKIAPTGDEFDQQKLLQYEQSVLSFYVSSHPVMQYNLLFSLFPHINFISPGLLKEQIAGTRLAMFGVCEQKQLKMTKNDKPYLDIRISDQIESISQKIWSPLATTAGPGIIPNQMVLLFGTAREDKYNPGDMQLNVDKVLPILNTTGIPVESIHAPNEVIANHIAQIIDAVIGSSVTDQLYNGTILIFKQTAYIKPQHYDNLKRYTNVNYGLAF